MVQAAQAPTEVTQDEHCRHLETIARGMINAVNNRDFNPASKAWSSTSLGWSSEVAFTTSPVKRGLREYLIELELMTKNNPDMMLEIVSLDATLNGASRGHAFADLEWHGFPTGFVRPCYAIYDFVKVQDRWACVKYRVLPGIRAGSSALQPLGGQ